jgi:hypothetical protein
MHHDTFNADFYVVVATVIPLLYLALTLQDQTYERVMNWSVKQLMKLSDYHTARQVFSLQAAIRKAFLEDQDQAGMKVSLPPAPPGSAADMIDKLRRGEELSPDMLSKDIPKVNWRLFWILHIAGGLILASGIVGEGLAIWALYARPSSQVIELTVLILSLVLLVAVAAVPLLRVGMLYGRAFTRFAGLESKSASDEASKPSSD